MTETRKWQKNVNFFAIDLHEFDSLTIDEAIEKLNSLKEKVPESYDHLLYYDEYESGSSFELKTWRYETDEEEKSRIDFVADITKQTDLKEFKRIKEKYNL